MGEHRIIRLGEQIREEISLLISSGKIKDPRVSTFLSISHVDVSRDLSHAKVFVSSFMDSPVIKKGVVGLQSASGYIQSVLSKKLQLRLFPQLTFVFDDSIRAGFEMVHKIDQLLTDDNLKNDTNSDS
ncbi:MAG TPA: 30S ribosome-binding factor RbfA [Treponema sp.]|nr:30S ribosome-binding factor RbfA [Treponema sp.]